MGNLVDKKHQKNDKVDGIDTAIQDFFISNGILSQEIEISNILNVFNNSFIIRRIIKQNIPLSSQQTVDLEKLKTILSLIYRTYTNSSIFETYMDLLFASNDGADYRTIKNIFYDCLFYTIKCIGFEKIELNDNSAKTLELLIGHIEFNEIDGKKLTTKEIFKQWVINEFPQLFYGFHCWLTKHIKEHKTNDNYFSEAHDISPFLNLTLTWYFVNNLPICYVQHLTSDNGNPLEKFQNLITEHRWHQLYSSEIHGLSLNRLESSLFNYKAATIIFFYCQSGNLFCICSNEEYKESPMPYGDGNTRIFRIWNDFKIFDIAPSKNIYLNTKSRGLKLGLIYGYSNLKPVISIDENFHSIDHELCKNDQIISVEAWGCGPQKAHSNQQDLKKWENKQIEKMKTVKLNAEEWNSNADKALLDLAGIKTEHSERVMLCTKNLRSIGKTITVSLSNLNQTRLNSDSKSAEIFNPNYENKNPRNLEWSGHQYKRFGWHLQYPPKDFYHQCVFSNKKSSLEAFIEHYSGKKVIDISTEDPEIRQYLYSARDSSAAKNLAKVLAHRCYQLGIDQIHYLKGSNFESSPKEQIFYKTLIESGIKLEEPEFIERIDQIPGLNHDEKDFHHNLQKKPFPPESFRQKIKK